MIKKDWWDKSYNPVKGCNGPNGDGVHCTYCYAKDWVIRCNYAEKVARAEIYYNLYRNCGNKCAWTIADELNLIEKIKSFKPHFFEYVYVQPLRKKPTIYFFSMSDPADWLPEWHRRIVEKIKQYPQHRFVVLTKRPRVYEKYQFPKNVWLGVTVTTQLQLNQLECLLCNYLSIYNTFFLSIEPIQEKIKLSGYIKNVIDWLIVGPETGTKKKIPGEWLDPFFSLVDIRVFMKTACSEMTDRPLRQEWPEGWKK